MNQLEPTDVDGIFGEHAVKKNSTASNNGMDCLKNAFNILLMGVRKAGKSSIFDVVFGNRLPHDTLYTIPTTTIVKHIVDTNNFVQYLINDFPGDFDTASDLIFERASCIVFVIDASVG